MSNPTNQPFQKGDLLKHIEVKQRRATVLEAVFRRGKWTYLILTNRGIKIWSDGSSWEKIEK